MSECFLSDEEIRELNRDLRILIATNGTLTRILNVVADEEIAVQFIKQKIHHVGAEIPECEQLPSGRILQRQTLLKGQSSQNPYVAAESLIAIDVLPPTILTSLTKTDRPIGEVIAADRLETFKEAASVWIGELPGWLALAGYCDSRANRIARRYRIISGGRPVIIITEYFLRSLFQTVPTEEADRRRQAKDIGTTIGDPCAPDDQAATISER